VCGQRVSLCISYWCVRVAVYDAQYCPILYNAELNPICHLLALLGGATIVVVSRLRVNGQVTVTCVTYSVGMPY
jgi:hypothetical protein